MMSWPTDGWNEERGAVGEVCPRCERIRVFSVEEHMVYYSFLGMRITHDHRAARRIICWNCGWWRFYPILDPYSEWLTIEEAERLPLSEVVRLTNPSLHEEKLDDDRERRRRRRRD